nr:hypothetical protein [Planococcus glaciei]
MTQNDMQQKKFPVINLDLLPTGPESRTWSFSHYFSVWMGSVHNIPSYVTIGGFFCAWTFHRPGFCGYFLCSPAGRCPAGPERACRQ